MRPRQDASTNVHFTRFVIVAFQFLGCLESYISFIMPSISPNKSSSPHGRLPTAPAFGILAEPRLWSAESNPVPPQLYPLPAAKDQMRQKAPLLAMFALQPQLRLSRACQAPEKEIGQLQGYQRRTHAQTGPDGGAD